MFFRILKGSFTRKTRRKAAAVLAVALGASIIAALVSVAMVVGDRVQSELRAYGANLEVVPETDSVPIEIGGVDYSPLSEGGYLDERELPKIKTIFWRHNIVGFAPFLSTLVTAKPAQKKVVLTGTWFNKTIIISDTETFITGVKTVNPYWSVEGRWIDDEADSAGAMVGVEAARKLQLKPGDTFTLDYGQKSQRLTVVGIVRAGGPEDRQVFAPLALVQRLTDKPHQVKKVTVSALTTPEDELARRDPETMTPEEYERWYCTPYISAIARQIEEVISNSKARPILQIAESEGIILQKITLLILLIVIAAVAASALGVGSTMTTMVLERSGEIGLLKAIGAEDRQVKTLFLFESAFVGVIGGLLGYGLGAFFAQILGKATFGSSIPPNGVVVVLTLLAAVFIALLGSLGPVGKIVRIEPAIVLHQKL